MYLIFISISSRLIGSLSAPVIFIPTFINRLFLQINTARNNKWSSSYRSRHPLAVCSLHILHLHCLLDLNEYLHEFQGASIINRTKHGQPTYSSLLILFTYIFQFKLKALLRFWLLIKNQLHIHQMPTMLQPFCLMLGK